MRAYAVVGPTNANERRLSSLASAADAGVVDGTSAIVLGAGAGSGAKDHARVASPSGSAMAALAFPMAASILARFRTIPASASSRARSSSPYRATTARSNPAKAARKDCRLRRMVSQDNPDWNASSVIRSKRPMSSRTGRPHSAS